jgi:hypothetical protein
MNCKEMTLAGAASTCTGSGRGLAMGGRNFFLVGDISTVTDGLATVSFGVWVDFRCENLGQRYCTGRRAGKEVRE